jgi:hypothetical protein
VPGYRSQRSITYLQADPTFSLDEDSGTERRVGDGAGHLNIGRLETEDRESDAANDDSERDDSDQEEQDILQPLLSDIVHEYYSEFLSTITHLRYSFLYPPVFITLVQPILECPTNKGRP